MFEVIFGGLVAGSLVVTYLTNPFSRMTIVRLPFRLHLESKTRQIIDDTSKVKVRNAWYWKLFAQYQCGLYIITTRYLHSPASSSTTTDLIIRDIHTLRYDPKKLLLISGDHFNGLFVRNLGVFYYPMLDRSIHSSTDDWRNRQVVYLQSVAYALSVFSKDPRLTTTIVSMGRYAATCVNFYAYPSDSLYGIMYALAALSGIEQARPVQYKADTMTLDTISAAKTLRHSYHDTLQKLYESYKQTIIDNDTGMISTLIHLSGAKDITRRESSFYDNVIYWKTTQLAMKLGVIQEDKKFLDKLKRKIIDTYWLDKEGYFLEDLSAEGAKEKYYSSDWLIVLATNFLDPLNPSERQYYIRSIQYIQKQKIDKPFAIRYQQDTRAHRQFLPVRLAVASYGGDAIWSFWGMEYIKSLILLYKSTGNDAYKIAARHHLDKYDENIRANGGFPEVYDGKGRMLQTPLYKSIRQTGWVIGFEQAEEMYRSIC